ncbi:hypothetical protein N7492_003088 [Penicillium capsulatum]|uniref:Uncharacterized protein n=1 Tax=Penicillium capsulatum TaxID=69766 RepID=A0A9W9IIT3_9EURO|nr:hypothetical protein N7492_003088 [Penicillium capsulatum]KAJ6122321.1 hypothetical protein N7512_004786 [Penicillium capsulatum]
MSEQSDPHHDEGFFERILNPHKHQSSKDQAKTEDHHEDQEDHEIDERGKGNEKEMDPFREYLKGEKDLQDDLKVYDRLV